MSTTTRTRGRVRIRVGLALTAALALVGLVLAPGAYAATSVSWGGTGTWGGHVWMNGEAIEAHLYNLDVVGGGTLKAYCVDKGTPINKGDTWDSHPLASQITNGAKASWVLQHSYPRISLAALSSAAGVALVDERTAIAGTQAALWHYSNSLTLDDANNSTGVKAIYAYLTGAANVGATVPSAPTLSLTPATASGTAGGRVGPITVAWSGSGSVDVSVSPSGFSLFSAATGGSPVTTAADGDRLWLQVPAGAAAGSATVTATASTELAGGFILINGARPDAVQKLAYAGSETVTASDEATLSWVVKPTPTPSDSGTTPPSPTESGTTTPPVTSPPPSTEPAPVPPVETSPSTLPTTGAGGVAPLAMIGLLALLLGGIVIAVTRAPRSARHH